MPDGLEILPVHGIGEITPGTDLATVIHDAAPWLRDGDVLVVTSKIVSKAEGQLVELPPDGPQREAAREAVLVAETARTVARRGPTRIVQTHHGYVMAAAGIDASNVDPSRLVLLPKDPDASARALRAELRERFALDVGVIVSDTMGRPWRIGLTDVALGAAGLEPILDYRGEHDPYGNEMQVTQMAVVDELAGAAELVKGKFDQVPVGVVRGFLARTAADDGAGARSLVRESEQDLFALGTAEARAAGLAEAAALGDAPGFRTGALPPTPLDRILAGVAPSAGTRLVLADIPPTAPAHTLAAIAGTVADPGDPDQLVALGVDVHRLRCALLVEGLATLAIPAPAGTVRLLLGLSP